MDQNSTGGTDKRNWRERLGIANKDGMPRIADDFKEPASARSPSASARPGAPTIKPAPMAPRLTPRPGTPAPSSRPLSNPPGALKAGLGTQREGAEKLNERRLTTAQQRPAQPSGESAKPKFSFAEPDAGKPSQQAKPAQPLASQPRYPAANQAPSTQPPAPQLQPPRQQLGQGPGFKPLPPAVPPSYAQQPQPRSSSAPPQPYQRQYTQPPYQPPQPYRPIDPNTGYAVPPSAYVPPQQRSNYVPGTYQPQPIGRPSVPTRSAAQGYPQGQADLRPSPRLGAAGPSRNPPQVGYDDEDDIFEQPAAPAGRRATANDYQQAYRNAEPAYEEDLPRSRLPLILMILLVLALASGIGGIWAYNNLIKTPTTSTSENAAAPVVAAPTQPAKVSPDNNAAGKADQSSPPAAGGNKKQIYDRIIGDREVLSGEMKANEEAPVQPDVNAIPPAPGDSPNAGTGNDGMPLPLPPPPGSSSGGTQGTLEQNKSSNVAQVAPAAEPSSAAISTGGTPSPKVAEPKAVIPVNPAEPPVPSSQPAQPSKLAAGDTAANTITDPPDAPVKPAVTPAKPKVTAAAKKVVPEADKALGSKPLVLVPPAKIASADANVATPIAEPPAAATNSLYNGPAVGTAVQPVSPATTPAAKRKSLSDLFKSNNTPAATAPATAPAAPVATSTPVASGYVAQLASFKTKAEATAEYARLVQKHGAIISKYAPIIENAEVAGSPRFRLNIGPMASMDIATNICSSLFSAGERDCVVRRQ